ncbi:MAG: DUF3592 domain-containing protein [Thermoanaerobaculia bacterium]|nr:DUF3592 domain-containing protein [Thermoanaerobaculia bacterium]
MHPHLSQPPRSVPISLSIANIFNGFSQFGWIVLGFGGIFFWIFALNADFSLVTFRGEVARIEGEITGIEKTNASEGGSKRRRGTPVYANHYAYSIAGQRFNGVSYETGSSRSVGEQVQIEYLARNPKASRIEGMRRAMFGPFASFVVIFPLVGGLIAIVSMLGGRKRNALLRNGIVANGKLIEKRATNMRVNKQTVYALTFEFTGRDGRPHKVTTKTHNPQRLEDEALEPLLYDPDKPSNAYLLDEIPARPTVTPDGQLEGRPGLALALLIIPLITIAGHGLVAALRLGLFK